MSVGAAIDVPRSPDVAFGDLFADVQRAGFLADQKTFADAVPKETVPVILEAYETAKRSGAQIDLREFVRTHFLLPESPTLRGPHAATLEEHLTSLWSLLQRAPDMGVIGSSLLALPNPYIVPGGRFREIYYWDSYFTMLGLRESGQEEMIASMVENFAYLLRTFGLIPNGNRTYYLSRSQPPMFALMVELLAETRGDAAYRRFLPHLKIEYAYWQDRSAPTQHVVTLPDGGTLNRYYDQLDTPRPESFAIDEEIHRRAGPQRTELYRNLRAACASGWDFSTRWLADASAIESIRTLELAPVDLNCLLYELERTLARASRAVGETAEAEEFAAAAERRRDTILRACWSEKDAFFFDYDIVKKRPADSFTLAALFPLFVRIATPEQADAVAQRVRDQFLKEGGLVTTLVNTGQQWDAPNGWAPLQWIAIRGLENYGHHELAAEIARRWIKLNREVYARTGRMMEKYNVENVMLEAGGGEYPGQDGFGWTNGVLLKLIRDYERAEER